MNDLELLKKILSKRLDDLEDVIINTGSGCEMGISKRFVNDKFNNLRQQLGLIDYEFKYGRFWFKTRKEAMNNRFKDEIVYFDEGMKKYYLMKKK